jgi:hypothetical protein
MREKLTLYIYNKSSTGWKAHDLHHKKKLSTTFTTIGTTAHKDLHRNPF